MPKNKDLKRLIRARMAKTGESYTAARAHIVGRTPPPLPDDVEGVAGQRDAVMVERTGRDWRAWVALLDEAGATELAHADIARLVNAELDDSWWAQTVSVGYERLRGLRAVGQQRDGSFQASKSKTLRAPREQVFAHLVDAIAGWEGATLDGHTAPKSVRVVEADGSKATLWLAEKGEDRCTVSVAHRGLSSQAAVDAAKAAWGERLSAAADAL